jgi:hypothetical protein
LNIDLTKNLDITVLEDSRKIMVGDWKRHRSYEFSFSTFRDESLYLNLRING